jgi:hypothetical protein
MRNNSESEAMDNPAMPANPVVRPEVLETYGMWMIAERRGRRQNCWNIANYVAAIVKEDGCNGGLLVAANNHCLMSKFGKFGSHHC